MTNQELINFCNELQKETNELLDVIQRMNQRQEENMRELSENWKRAQREAKTSRTAVYHLTELIQSMEKSFARGEDEKLARLIYHTLDFNAPIHDNGTKGVSALSFWKA